MISDSPLWQYRPDEMYDLMAVNFPRRNESSFAWKSAISMHLAPPGLRGFWPTSSVDENGFLIDLSGQGNNLTLNGNPQLLNWNLAPSVQLDGTGDYFNDAGGVGSWCDILGSETYILPNRRGVTVSGWFRFDDAAGAAEGLITKWDTSGANDRSYALYRHTTGEIRFYVSSDGTAGTVQSVTTASAPPVDTWFWAAGRYDDATEEIDVWYNAETANLDLAIAGWAGTLDSNLADFVIGGKDGGGDLMTGYFSLCALYASSVRDSLIFCLYEQSRSLFGV